MESNAEKHDLQASSLASLFFRVPKVADIIVYKLNVKTIRGLLLSTEPAIYHFCKGPGGGFDRFLNICIEGKKRRKYIERLADYPRLLVDEWRDKLMGRRLVKEDIEGSDDVSPPFSLRFWRLQCLT